MDLTQTQTEWKGARRLAAMVACALLAFGTCASAMSLHVGVSAPTLPVAIQPVDQAVAQETPLHADGSVHPPILIRNASPEYTAAARKAKLSGDVELSLRVDKKGNPSHIRVVRGMGMGLNQKAVEAVRQYKFKPATQNGKPVAVDLVVDVNFQIF
ncbi:MAG TPA: energy transducer TonB [Acidobacteriaceae bacterium]|jgi:TonB family protein|nr:energy transducer TonB [Acidobacteriaceae bacterium]